MKEIIKKACMVLGVETLKATEARESNGKTYDAKPERPGAVVVVGQKDGVNGFVASTLYHIEIAQNQKEEFIKKGFPALGSVDVIFSEFNGKASVYPDKETLKLA
jgi:hypothetical protein